MAWALEIQPDCLRLCEARQRGGRVHVTRAGETSLAPGLVQPSLAGINLPAPAALAPVLRQLAREAGCRGWVHVALPDEVFILRSVLTEELPAEPGEARRFLRWQARDLLPFPAEEARLDHLPGLPAPGGRQRVVCLLARERVLAEYERLLADAQLAPARLDARIVTLAQAVSDRLGRRAAAVAAFAPGRMSLLVVEDACPRFSRTLAIASPLEAIERERLVREVADSLAFCRESEGTPPLAELLLEGPELLVGGLAGELAEWLEIRVSPLPAEAFLLAAATPSMDPVTGWGAVIGAAIAPC